jgi:hypothetical protein
MKIEFTLLNMAHTKTNRKIHAILSTTPSLFFFSYLFIY